MNMFVTIFKALSVSLVIYNSYLCSVTYLSTGSNYILIKCPQTDSYKYLRNLEGYKLKMFFFSFFCE